MNLLITGVCGFVGSTLAETLLESTEGLNIVGVDNLIVPGRKQTDCVCVKWASTSYTRTSDARPTSTPCRRLTG